MNFQQKLATDRCRSVAFALEEDLGDGDITAQLISADAEGSARIISRESAVVCGLDWVDEVFRQLGCGVSLEFLCADGDRVDADQELLRLHGNVRQLLSGERSALNFLQLLSGTATRCAYYAERVAGTGVKLLDTRKTIPGLRTAQKYAVSIGGCHMHRIGLYDAYLIKENHIAACGSVAAAVNKAQVNHPGKPVEVEVESLEELQEAIDAGSDRIMLDNFSLPMMRKAVSLTAGRAELEASGGITDETLRPIAETGVDYISIGALTKDCKAIDLSMRLI